MGLEYISVNEYIERGYDKEAILRFDCGVASFNDFYMKSNKHG